jgi:hypothetical protein
MSKCHYCFGRCRRLKRSYYCSWEYHIAAQTPGASRKSRTSHADATRPPCRHIFRDAHFEIIQFCLFVSSFSFFIVSLLSFISEILCQPLRGGWNNTRCPQNLELRWLHASRLSSCGLSFYRSLFSSFSFPFPSIPLFFFRARVTVRQSQFRFPFIPVTSRNVIFFSSFPQPSSFVLVCPNL